MILTSRSKKRKITMGRLEDLAKDIATIFPPELILASNYVAKCGEAATGSSPDPQQTQNMLALVKKVLS